MATFLVRAAGLDAAGPSGFVDTSGTTHETNIDALAAAGVTVGCAKDPLRFCPADATTRAQMALVPGPGLRAAATTGHRQRNDGAPSWVELGRNRS